MLLTLQNNLWTKETLYAGKQQSALEINNTSVFTFPVH
jgi:hypothetical protein